MKSVDVLTGRQDTGMCHCSVGCVTNQIGVFIDDTISNGERLNKESYHLETTNRGVQ